MELLIASFGDDNQAFEKWGLEPGTLTYLLRYLNSLRSTYDRAFLDWVIEQGSGLFTTRTVWEILWQDIDPLLLYLSPQEPYANIFFNDTTEEVADRLTGFFRINNGRSDSKLVEVLSMWNGYEVVDVFWENVDIQVGGNSGNGQFAPQKLSFLGQVPDVLDDLEIWSMDHGKTVFFTDIGKDDVRGIETHLFSLLNNTYDPSVVYALPANFSGFVNATVINEGVPVYYCQPRMLLVDNYWRERALGIQEPTWKDGSFIWLEPISGLGKTTSEKRKKTKRTKKTKKKLKKKKRKNEKKKTKNKKQQTI